MYNDYNFYRGGVGPWSAQFTSLQKIQSQIIEYENAKVRRRSFQYQRKGYTHYSYRFEKQHSFAQWYAEEMGEVRLLYNAYEQIQKIREQITGQQIKYRLYATVGADKTGQGGHIGYIEVGSSDLHKYLTQAEKAIRLNQSAVQQAIIKKEKEIQDKKILNSQLSRVTAYEQSIDAINQIYNKLFTAEGHNKLSRGRTADYEVDGKTLSQSVIKYQGKKYNQGVVLETIDKLVFNERGQLRTQLLPQSDNTVFNNFIKESLNKFKIEKDSVSGFKQGDNGLFQIKANKAQLMDYSTIMMAIDSILSIGKNIYDGQRDIAEQELLRMFSGDKDSIMEISQRKARDAIEQIAKNEIIKGSNNSSHKNDISQGGKMKDFM